MTNQEIKKLIEWSVNQFSTSSRVQRDRDHFLSIAGESAHRSIQTWDSNHPSKMKLSSFIVAGIVIRIRNELKSIVRREARFKEFAPLWFDRRNQNASIESQGGESLIDELRQVVSPSEIVVLQLILSGRTYKECAKIMNRSTNRVHQKRNNAARKILGRERDKLERQAEKNRERRQMSIEFHCTARPLADHRRVGDPDRLPRADQFEQPVKR